MHKIMENSYFYFRVRITFTPWLIQYFSNESCVRRCTFLNQSTSTNTSELFTFLILPSCVILCFHVSVKSLNLRLRAVTGSVSVRLKMTNVDQAVNLTTTWHHFNFPEPLDRLFTIEILGRQSRGGLIIEKASNFDIWHVKFNDLNCETNAKNQ